MADIRVVDNSGINGWYRYFFDFPSNTYSEVGTTEILVIVFGKKRKIWGGVTKISLFASRKTPV